MLILFSFIAQPTNRTVQMDQGIITNSLIISSTKKKYNNDNNVELPMLPSMDTMKGLLFLPFSSTLFVLTILKYGKVI